MIAALLALVVFGAPPCDGSLMDWEIEYASGFVESYPRIIGPLEFEPAPFDDYRARYRLSSGPGPWSVWSDWIEVEHYPGDVDGDGAVGSSDFIELRMHFGEVAP